MGSTTSATGATGSGASGGGTPGATGGAAGSGALGRQPLSMGTAIASAVIRLTITINFGNAFRFT